jgi:hypothetical protein
MHLRNVLGYRKQRGHRAKRAAGVVLVQPGGDNSNPSVRQIHAEIDDRRVEELDLVDANNFHAEHEVRSKLGRIVHCDGIDAPVVSRDNPLVVEAIVDGWLKDLRALSRDLRPAHATDKLFAFAAEHAAGYDFYPPASRA